MSLTRDESILREFVVSVRVFCRPFVPFPDFTGRPLRRSRNVTGTGESRIASRRRDDARRWDVTGRGRDVKTMLYGYLRWMLNNKCARSMKTLRSLRDGWASLVYCFWGHDHSGKGCGRDYNVSIPHDNDEAPKEDYRLSFPYVYEINWLID